MGEIVEMNKGIEAKSDGTGPIDKSRFSGAPKKLNYDELENVCKQLSDQNMKMYKQLENMQIEAMFKRLDYLFRVLENSHAFGDAFVGLCVNEITHIMDMKEEGHDPSEAESAN